MKNTPLPRLLPRAARVLPLLVVLCATGHSLSPQAQTAVLGSGAAPPFQRTEEREPCADYESTGRPLFGDLHVHTSYSFDSYLSSQRRDPWDAYRYARGKAIILPDANGEQTVTARIGRPLDFTAVTDHAEFFGQINVCNLDSSNAGS